jgi:surfeit locus 1 family protein
MTDPAESRKIPGWYRWLALAAFLLAAAALCIRLGFWQLDRMAQRRQANVQLTAMLAAPTLTLDGTQSTGELMDMEYRRVIVRGTYDFEHQVAIRNQVWTQSWGDEMGYALLTPLIPSNGSAAVWVERGWIPAANSTPASWRQFDEPGMVVVEGLIRLPREKGEMGGGVPDPTLAPDQTRLDFWNFVNLGRLQQQAPYPLLGVYIQQAPVGEQEKLPYRWLPEVEISEGAHLGFALMWFTYAALLLFGFPFYLIKTGVRSG